MCTPAQGLFAHAATLGAPTIVVTHAKHERYKNICAGEPPERVHAARRLAYQVGVLAFGCRTQAAADRPAQEAGRFGMLSCCCGQAIRFDFAKSKLEGRWQEIRDDFDIAHVCVVRRGTGPAGFITPPS